MKKIFFLVLVFLFLNCMAGHETGNGGGIAEVNLNMARLFMPKILKNCLTSSFCLQTEEEKTLAKKVAEILPLELENTNQIKFLSGKENPGFFFVDNQVRVAKTGSSPGSIIYINRDLIYEMVFGRSLALSLPQSVAIIFHEFTHHAGGFDLNFVDATGSKIALFSTKNITRLTNIFGSSNNPFRKVEMLTLDSIELEPGFENLILRIVYLNETKCLTPLIKAALNKYFIDYCLFNKEDKFCIDSNFTLNRLIFAQSSSKKFRVNKGDTVMKNEIYVRVISGLKKLEDVGYCGSNLFYHRATFILKVDTIDHRIVSFTLDSFKNLKD